MSNKIRNPNWTRDEIILALDLYKRNGNSLPDENSPQVRELSELLKKLAPSIGAGSNFRNASGVAMKLANLRSIDPLYLKQGKKGLPGGGHTEKVVWAELHDKPQLLAALANSIKSYMKSAGSARPPEIEEEVAEASEGRTLTRVHLYRERDKRLAKKKKAAVLKATGGLACEVCGFDFQKIYGVRGDGFIEVHHLVPVSKLGPESKTKLSDLAVLCSNCHRMVHAKSPWISIEELRLLLTNGKKKQ